MMLENKAQEEAIHTVNKQVLVIACPGSGKTTTLLQKNPLYGDRSWN